MYNAFVKALVSIIFLINLCSLAFAQTSKEVEINILAPQLVNSYKEDGVTYKTISNFFGGMSDYRVKFQYLSYSDGWKLIKDGEDLCHFFAVLWPTDKNILYSKHLTLRMRTPHILIYKQSLIKNGYKYPYNAEKILKDKDIFGAMIKSNRFDLPLYNWLIQLLSSEQEHVLISDYSIEQLFHMLGKKRVDYLIISPDTAIFIPLKKRKEIAFIPLKKEQKVFTEMRLICGRSQKHEEFMREANKHADTLYSDKDWLRIWGYVNFYLPDHGKKSLQEFVKSQVQ